MSLNPDSMSAATRKRWMAARISHGGYVGGKEQPDHYIWRSMLIRCDHNHKNYEHVSVCERWRQYENFVEDMGSRPSPEHTLDRWPDAHGNYEPNNCRWATWEQQGQNKRKTVYYSDGQTEGTVGVWARRLEISVPLARYRWKALGTFSPGMKFKYRFNGDAIWHDAPAPRPHKPNPLSKWYTDGVRTGRLIDWSRWLGESPSALLLRWKHWGTFEKGKKWKCVAQNPTKKLTSVNS